MITYMYNGGTYSHRGVWHVVELIGEETVEASTRKKVNGSANHTSDYSHPSYVVYKGRAICGQVEIRQANILLEGPRWCWPRNPHKEHVVHGRTIKENNMMLIDPPMVPGPLCSRCKNKAGV